MGVVGFGCYDMVFVVVGLILIRNVLYFGVLIFVLLIKGVRLFGLKFLCVVFMKF